MPTVSSPLSSAPHAAQDTHPDLNYEHLVPGVTIECRDERWIITHSARSKDGWRLRVRGISDFVRDTTATFFTALEKDITVFDPAKVTIAPDDSAGFRDTKLWLETTLRSTPVPLYFPGLSVAQDMLADPLQYQLSAVHKALSEEHIRPRILLADAVGLGKTLEIGMILAELIRRGRGERILVVTPKHVLEQFQQEMWTRFAIPLVRLDSQGIQKVRQKLPASKNPFTYFPRVIVSMDTLKQDKYRAQLQKVRWDAVVIDEIHNATNAGSKNNDLARTLAPTTESLILASATPHNGNPESFKEILRLLDPLAVFPNGDIDMEVAKKLIIRRHRNSPEVAAVVGDKWAQRMEPLNVPVAASPEENAVAREISDNWVHGHSASDPLFPWTLVKAFLSSPAALKESIESRQKTLSDRKGAKAQAEMAALQRLHELNEKVTPETSAKYQELAAYLNDIGISKKSTKRVVIFSERVATLKWLQDNLTKHLGLKQGAVEMMHGGLTDTEQMALIDEFKREKSDIRVLVTGDVASEGVNLHTQCHDLVHFDIPWSLIRIQQRNGRIDRYGQRERPQIATLLLDTADLDSIGELRVLTRLIEREHEAHKLLGDASSLMGKHSTRAEEDAIREVLAGQVRFSDAVADPEDIASGAHLRKSAVSTKEETEAFSIERLLAGYAEAKAEEKVPERSSFSGSRNSLYPNELSYLEDALSSAFLGEEHASIAGGGIEFKEYSSESIVEFVPPRDLQRRLDFLPQDYVDYRRVKERLSLATTKERGNAQLKAAREGDSEKSWPVATYLGPLHPVTGWAADRALSRMAQNQIFAIKGTSEETSVLLVGTLTNERGQVVTSSFLVATAGALGWSFPEIEVIEDPYVWLRSAGLSEDSINVGDNDLPHNVQELLASSVEAATNELDAIRGAAVSHGNERVERWQVRADRWIEHGTGQQTLFRSKAQMDQERELLKSTTPSRSLIRPLVVVLPKNA
ncbi:DEAD/DEAH box helicase [Corynebacterium vitaeruminis]|uniref:DEAD/DEAH box helicase n=1 Tax=Corynebacterium vitaeruminis TaxID=38305 RepID=UPI0023F05C95|nr:DEAD/DEAH box helicase [Corynebacterium vitaeruminis]